MHGGVRLLHAVAPWNARLRSPVDVFTFGNCMHQLVNQSINQNFNAMLTNRNETE